jgi:hypothetical protein
MLSTRKEKGNFGDEQISYFFIVVIVIWVYAYIKFHHTVFNLNID